MSTYWVVERGRIEPAAFFRHLPACFPDTTTLFFEGTSIDSAVQEVLCNHAEVGGHLPGRQTIHPVSKLFRCRFSLSLCAELEKLSEVHAIAEIADHAYAYRGNTQLVGFPDFCANEIYLSSLTPEPIVSRFASALGLKYWKYKNG